MMRGRTGLTVPEKKSGIVLIRDVVLSNMPPEAGVTRIEFEGPEIAIYVRNPRVVMEQMSIVKKIARAIRKRVVIRTDPSVRKPKDEAERIVRELVPSEAEIKSVHFDDTLGEMVIRAGKPGLVIGRGGQLRRKLLVETGWRVSVERASLLESRTRNWILGQLIHESEYRIKVLRRIGERIHRSPLYKDNYVRITALGAFREVGRSAILVETAESRILLDLGINPGGHGYSSEFPRLDVDDLRLDELDAVVVTHAHLDHSGLVPYLFKYGYEGPVYATEATRDLMAVVSFDYLDVLKREGRTPPYTQREVRKMVLHTITLRYGEVTDITPDIRITFYNAGHILGSAMVHLHIGEGLHNIVYTGDFKYARTRLLERAADEFPRLETLIMESTYGAADQPPRQQAEEELIATIKKTAERGGKVLIPVMAVGRGQEIMLVLADAFRRGLLPEMPVYIEGMIDEVTAIHTHHADLLAREPKEAIFRNENPFEAEFFRRVTSRDERMKVVESEEPCIVLATSGMLAGGPSVEYLKMMAEDPRNTLIFVSYQVQGTLGRKIKDGAREIEMISPEGKVFILKIAMDVHSIEGFSGHSDRRQLLSFLSRIKPKPRRIILGHGEPESIASLANSIRRLRQRLGLPPNLEIYAPSILDSIRLT